MAALKIFAVRNKNAAGEVQRLVKAATRGQVRTYLASNIEIESLDAAELVDVLDKTDLKVEDATRVADDDGADETATSTATTGTPEAGATASAASAAPADATDAAPAAAEVAAPAAEASSVSNAEGAARPF